MNKPLIGLMCAAVLAVSACSREQSDWEKARSANNADSYELFVKKYPNGEFTAQAQARVRDLYEERDWQKARDADTPEAYQTFLKQYPEGKWTEEARIRVENFTLAQTPSGTPAAGAVPAAAGSAATATAESPPAAATAAKAAPATAGKSPAAAAPTNAGKPAAPAAVAKSTPKYATKPDTKAPAQAAAKGAAGAYGVQLGAFSAGKAAAEQRWTLLQKKYPAILGGLTHQVSTKKIAGKVIYRLQATELTEANARAACKSLKAKSQPCVVVLPQ
jgi:hypothetical protein